MDYGLSRISCYKNVYDSNSNLTCTIDSLLEGIYNCRWEEQITEIRNEKNKDKRSELKKNLPGVTFAGTFSTRSEKDMTSYSGVIVIDVDTNSREVAVRVKNKLMRIQTVFAAFFSPSMGVKFLVKVDTPPQHHKEYVFPIIKKRFEEMLGVKIDSSGKDLSRLCFVSMDEDMYYNGDSIPFSINIDKEIKDKRDRLERQRLHARQNSDKLSYDSKFVFDKCLEWTKKNEKFVKSNRNNFVHLLACNLNRAGIDPNLSIELIFGKYSSLGVEEISATVNGVYKRNSNEFGSRPIYDYNKRNSFFK